MDPDLVEFETLEEGPDGVRVAAVFDPEAAAGAADEAEEELEDEAR